MRRSWGTLRGRCKGGEREISYCTGLSTRSGSIEWGGYRGDGEGWTDLGNILKVELV